MINLLPPEIKSQMRFAKYNALVARYLWMAVGLVAAGGLAFGGTYLYLTQGINQATTELAQKTTVINSFKDLQANVKALNDRTNSLKTLQQGQSKFSSLLSDLAAVTPKGVFINTIALTGDPAKPVQISATASSYNQAVALRDALAKSPRVAGVDLQALNSSNAGVAVQLTLAFKPGLAK